MKKILSILLLTGWAITSCSKSPEPTKNKPKVATVKPAEVKIHGGDLLLFKALPKVMQREADEITARQIALGKQLFFDTRMSKNHDVSCNSCHGLDTYGVDGKSLSEGHRKQLGGRNSPSVYNAAAHLAQFWDGRAQDVEAQALGPVLNPVEMALPNEATATAVLASIPGYVKAFADAFPGDTPAVSFENFGRAVGAFERTLLTPAPWDAYLTGNKAALTSQQKRGFNRFIETGCGTCHQQEMVGGTMYKKLGEKVAWPDLKDKGRSMITHNGGEDFFFKVPSLRNVAKTGPYLHDGSVATLPVMVTLMAKYQLGKALPGDQVSDIVSWLKALTGTLPESALQPPELPPSGAKTPNPNPS